MSRKLVVVSILSAVSIAFADIKIDRFGQSSVWIQTTITNNAIVIGLGTRTAMSPYTWGNVTIPSKSGDLYVRYVADEAFDRAYPNLWNLYLPSTIISIGNHSFHGFSGKLHFTPENIIHMGAYAFHNHDFAEESVEQLNMPNLVEIGEHAFSLTSIRDVRIPKIKSIPEYTFWYCEKLTNVMISSVEVISNGAFASSGIQTLTLPETLKSIGEKAFDKCTNLTMMVFEGRPPIVHGDNLVGDNVQGFYKAKYADLWQQYAGAGRTFYGLPVSCIDDALPMVANPSPIILEKLMSRAVDARLAHEITNETAYTAFKDWVSIVTNAEGCVVDAEAIMQSDFAWISYALSSRRLIDAVPIDEDINVDEFKPISENGKFEFTVSVKDITVGSSATADNLKKVFGLEGGTDLDSLSSENVDITFGTPSDGKVKFTAGPSAKNANATTFFMKVKMTP